MKRDMDCPRCGEEFECREWDVGECPRCKNEYWFDEYCLPDYSDCWTCVEWQDFRKDPLIYKEYDE